MNVRMEYAGRRGVICTVLYGMSRQIAKAGDDRRGREEESKKQGI